MKSLPVQTVCLLVNSVDQMLRQLSSDLGLPLDDCGEATSHAAAPAADAAPATAPQTPCAASRPGHLTQGCKPTTEDLATANCGVAVVARSCDMPWPAAGPVQAGSSAVQGAVSTLAPSIAAPSAGSAQVDSASAGAGTAQQGIGTAGDVGGCRGRGVSGASNRSSAQGRNVAQGCRGESALAGADNQGGHGKSQCVQAPDQGSLGTGMDGPIEAARSEQADAANGCKRARAACDNAGSGESGRGLRVCISHSAVNDTASGAGVAAASASEAAGGRAGSAAAADDQRMWCAAFCVVCFCSISA